MLFYLCYCFREEGQQFDVIFGDLTDIPVHGRDTETWAFVRAVIRQALLLLPVGEYNTDFCLYILFMFSLIVNLVLLFGADHHRLPL